MFGLSSPNKSELVLVYDIGSSSVGGALFETHPGGAAKIIYSIREPITLEDTLDFERFLTLTVKSLDVLSEKINKSGLGAPKKIFCVLSSPWYASQTRIISIDKTEPFLFTEKLATELINKEISLFEEEYLSKYAQAKEKTRSIEIKTIRTVLNGYDAPNPYNQSVKSFEMTIFISISPEAVLTKIETTISKYFHRREIKFSSFVMASFVVTRDVFAHLENFLLIDLGGEVTDISMVKKTILRGSISFPAGCNFMIRGVVQNLNCTIEEATSYISLYRDGHAVGTLANKLDPVMVMLKDTWLKQFQESLANLSNDISIPSSIFLAVDKDYYNFFSEIIKTEQFNQYTLTESKFEITPLGTEALAGIATFKDGVLRDPFIIIEAIYINRFFH